LLIEQIFGSINLQKQKQKAIEIDREVLCTNSFSRSMGSWVLHPLKWIGPSHFEIWIKSHDSNGSLGLFVMEIFIGCDRVVLNYSINSLL